MIIGLSPLHSGGALLILRWPAGGGWGGRGIILLKAGLTVSAVLFPLGGAAGPASWLPTLLALVGISVDR
ncbi:hypothetical protein AB0K18_36035 [Nonomuraea sp. NPDC049421]|uniref:hypothetical protein n=1 Tax=unclassified Nonomuraea TaxID=2593643 RepID=UPI0034322507